MNSEEKSYKINHLEDGYGLIYNTLILKPENIVEKIHKIELNGLILVKSDKILSFTKENKFYINKEKKLYIPNKIHNNEEVKFYGENDELLGAFIKENNTYKPIGEDKNVTREDNPKEGREEKHISKVKGKNEIIGPKKQENELTSIGGLLKNDIENTELKVKIEGAF